MIDLYIAEWPLMGFVFACFAAFFGACVGSFLNVCIWRIPRDESVIAPRSHCPKCERLIPWYLNIPVLSWVALGGKCRWCRTPISIRYLGVELLTALLFVMVYLQYTQQPSLLEMVPLSHEALIPIYWVFLAGLVCGTFVDFDHMIIPDSVTIGGMVVGPIFSVLVPAMHGADVWYLGLKGSLIGGGVGFGLLYLVAVVGEKIFKKEAMGFGDVKLMGAVGAFLGWKAVLFTIVTASAAGSVAGLTLIALKKNELQGRIPFGPYLSLGAAVWLFWGERILGAYLKILSL
ncbi:MAG: prepilin peptidase [Lentisphaerae bacterium]|nr:prepilin peptidase [Lentisphaerota bacterium]